MNEKSNEQYKKRS